MTTAPGSPGTSRNPDRDQTLARELTDASIEHEGKRYIRASVAARIIGIGPGAQTQWIRTGKITPRRWRVPLGHKAPRGILTAWPLDQAIACARDYRPKSERLWSDAAIDFLAEHVGCKPIEDIAADLGRSVCAVRAKIGELGLSQRNAQGEMTTGEVGKLCGVSREAVQSWCLRTRPRLGFRRSPCAVKVKLISPDSLRRFFRSHPHILNAKSTAAQRRIKRCLLTASQRRRGVMA